MLGIADGTYLASFPGHRRNSLGPSVNSNCIRMNIPEVVYLVQACEYWITTRDTNDFPAANAHVSNCLLHDLHKKSSRSHSNKELLCPLMWSSNQLNMQLNYCEILVHDTTAFTAVMWWCSEIWLELPTLWERGLCIRLVLHKETNTVFHDRHHSY